MFLSALALATLGDETYNVVSGVKDVQFKYNTVSLLFNFANANNDKK